MLRSARQSAPITAINNSPFWHAHNWYCALPRASLFGKPDITILFESRWTSPYNISLYRQRAIEMILVTVTVWWLILTDLFGIYGNVKKRWQLNLTSCTSNLNILTCFEIQISSWWFQARKFYSEYYYYFISLTLMSSINPSFQLRQKLDV